MRAITRALTPAAATSKRPAAAEAARFAVIGTGWRADIFIRLAYLLPDRLTLTGVLAHSDASAERVARDWDAPVARTLEELLSRERPDFVVIAVPWAVTPGLVRELVERGIRVVAETPPAPDLDGLHSLWADVGARHLVQVAEQYPLFPLHAARLGLVRDGVIGTPTSVHVSSTHQYHAVALIRAFLDVGIGRATVQSFAATAPLIDPITPSGWTHDLTPKPATTTLATIDFGDRLFGVYDFTSNQWWNPVRPDHLTVRGSAGEIHDDIVVRMSDAVTPTVSHLDRGVSGLGMNFEGFDTTQVSLDGKLPYRNEFEGARLSDDEIAVAALLVGAGDWAHDRGPEPYPLAAAAHDRHLGLAIGESARTGRPAAVGDEPWGA
ncbi:Gfo/Idh/MocA family protein [Gryllotalpicola reticulitermitis]|uniref:Gfo/Idh/MocA family protein n=1 Tax=Gryllotalpicola reticulitermitis TaxID=1184153 RepID=A0ABV8Q2F9_9MICO